MAVMKCVSRAQTYLECYEVTLETVTNQDCAVVKHAEEDGLYIAQCRPDTIHLSLCDATEPRVVVYYLVFWPHKRLIGCRQV